MNCFKKSFLVIALLSLSASVIRAQEDVVKYLDMGVADAKILTKEYLRPYGEMLGRSLNGGWYNNAGVHKIGGFSFTLGANLAFAPASASTFDLTPILPLLESDAKLQNPNNHIAPTASGDMSTDDIPILQVDGANINLPNGTGFDMFPMPIVQAAVGLPFNTELALRFIPTIKIGDAGKVNLYGFGVKHSIKEYIPGVKNMPLINTSVMVNYSKLGSEINAEYNEGADQKVEINSGAFSTRLLMGVNIPFIAIYSGVGYGSTSTDFAVKGTYDIEGESISNPLTIDYKNNSFDFNIGMRLRFGVIALHGDYTFGEYSMVTAGIGLSFR